MHLAQHAEFIARVSGSTASNFRSEFSDTISRLSQNPYQFPPHDDPNLPHDTYRKAIFARWYKVIFSVEEDFVYVDAVVDGRADYEFECLGKNH